MKKFKNLVAIGALAILMSGCASTGVQIKQPLCSLLGAAAGGGIAAAVADPTGITAAAAVGGMVVGALLCNEQDADGDGVVDSKDQCPNTPKGVAVDAKGCPIDSDGDGVADYLDKCPNTPAGTAVDSTGCPLDSDGDGVADYQDKCPNTPSGVAVDATGCPLDTDGDGVADYLDKCPDTPAGTKVDTNGCPAILITLTGVNFAFNSSKIDVKSEHILDEAVAALNQAISVDIRIEGHTDSVGSEAYNLKLSQKRADAVKAYLVAHGIAASRLTTLGMGEAQPVASNNTAEGRYQNRRVEFHVIGAGSAMSSDCNGIPPWQCLEQPVTRY